MELESTQLADNLRYIKLIGRLDLEGVEQIQAQFTSLCQGEHLRLLVDLAQVSFIASTGIRLLLNSAKALASHEGRMAFLNPGAGLREVLDVIGVMNIIPIYSDLEAAQAGLSSD